MPTTLVRPEAAPWPAERAAEWQRRRGWRVGCNFIPSHASNALEMWQEASFDEGAIERELGLAAGIGFNSVRVFLHDLLWTHERAGFLARLERFLDIAARQGIGALLVFFDGVWNPHPQPGPQPEPRPRVHNAGWVQSPGAALLGEPARHASLRPYLQGVIDRFRDDPRIDGWDLFNEPDNPNPAYAAEEIANKDVCALALTERAFTWAREVAPVQPITAGVWRGSFGEGELSALDRVMLESSDLISFHHYGPEAALAGRVAQLRRFGRPLVCTEWLARGMQSRFDPQLAWFHEHAVDAYCWGLVAGRTQTQYGWDSWLKRYDAEPALWHHDVFRPDGTPFDPAEVAFIRSVTRA